MDLLTTAVVDITTLVASRHALRAAVGAELPAAERRLHKALRRELRRGALAYVDELARARRGIVDAKLLAACRLAAERELPRARGQQESLSRMLASQPGALAGVAAARNDLWRLAHLATRLRYLVAALREAGRWDGAARARRAATTLRRRLRKALAAYARVLLVAEGAGGLVDARQAAGSAIGARGATAAAHLASIGEQLPPPLPQAGGDVVAALHDLALDWGLAGFA